MNSFKREIAFPWRNVLTILLFLIVLSHLILHRKTFSLITVIKCAAYRKWLKGKRCGLLRTDNIEAGDHTGRLCTRKHGVSFVPGFQGQLKRPHIPLYLHDFMKSLSSEGFNMHYMYGMERPCGWEDNFLDGDVFELAVLRNVFFQGAQAVRVSGRSCGKEGGRDRDRKLLLALKRPLHFIPNIYIT